MRRREFITLFGGAVAWPVAARAQQTERIRRVGVLMGLAESDPEGQARVAAFRQGLEQLGWAEGRNVRIDLRWAAGEVDRARTDAAELAAFAPDVIFAGATSALAAVQPAAKTIPIVFAQVSDPVGAGFVASLARPGGNITGFTQYEFVMGGKCSRRLPRALIVWLLFMIQRTRHQRASCGRSNLARHQPSRSLPMP